MSKYITTPIYYVNGEAHIGHAYTTFIADTMARYERLKGEDTFFLTGTDEHGQKIEESAEKAGKPTQEFADEISATFKNLWDEFGISYDKFIRTTDEDHKKGVQKAFEVMYAKGDIYKDFYEGHYCVSCETFFPETQLIDGEFCPDCGRATSIVKEESYFFKLSNYEDKLLEHYANHPDFIMPRSRANEVVSFVKGGLRDLSVTRTSFSWGVKMPKSIGDDKHVMYVWLDALLNYITALGYGSDEAKMNYWPADIHFVGKDILRFHAIYWPAFLMSLGLELPKHIGAHGWWTRDGEKMSKSKGNVVSPKEVADAYGVENLRYFMLREVPFGQDGDFSQRAFIDRINSELSNDLGNLLNRIIGMSGKYSDFEIDSVDVEKYHAKEITQMNTVLNSLDSFMENLQTHRYLEELWKLFAIGNGVIQEYEPWVKMKNNQKDEALATVAVVANILAKAAVMLHPIMPNTTNIIADALSFEINNASYKELIIDKKLLKLFNIKKVPPLFPRVEEPLMQEAPKAEPETIKEEQNSNNKVKETKKEDDNLIEIGQFFETSLKVGTVVAAEEVPKSKKLLKLQVDLGEESPRQVVAGIKEFYSPNDLMNTQVCVVANLKPTKLMGMISEGMLLAAKDEDGLCLIRPEKPKKAGTPIG
ncbi:methionine--tRNA ligase [Sulfurimonas autotrophica]|uniref:Methionine--tRNA ligase n=1 Tax=Sulfurimonas autotrophica (strain ATCC BAA-671 / DSM 16294 / JCM 11897 / OK10) TaxID=563040 RepID=E0USL8_SULAO|nr:methionine--tRNA ligase [Sulfurimonas autotrophica]ADN09181.1 methionyl-tRNA synthetase [Sulfurimonas autotrophica DSM 16294]